MVLYVVGVLGVLSYPLLARKVFIDENAFMHGHGAIGFGADDALRAHEYALKAEGVIDALGADANSNQIYDSLTAFAAAELDALGLDVSAREYPIDADQRGRRRAGENGDAATFVASRKTTHAVVRAIKSSGREGVVFATPIGASDTDGPRADAAAIGVGLAFVKYLTTAKWLAKDFVWLVLDARAGSTPGGSTHAAVHAADAWLREYYGDESVVRRRVAEASTFARAGALQQAYVFEMPAGAAVDVVAVRPEGRNGALPNQDLLNTAVQLARRAFPRARVGLDLDPLDPLERRARAGRAGGARGEDRSVIRSEKHARSRLLALVAGMSSFAERVGMACFGTRRAFDVRRAVGDLRRASVFAWRCARGVPTGAHAAFKTFALDAVTLRLGAPLGAARDDARVVGLDARVTGEAFRQIGSLLETLARGSNNLIEQLHHSMFYYVMTSDDFFLSIAEYVAPQAAVSAAAAIVAIALATRGGDGDHGDHGVGDGDAEKERDFDARKEHDWAPALALAAAAHAAGAGVGYASLCFYDAALSPIAVTGMTTASAVAAHACLAWLASALYGGNGGLEAVSIRREPPWVTLKCVALATAATATAAVTFFNFPLAWPTTVALAPVCLSISQSRKTGSQSIAMKAKALAMALTPAFLALLVSLIEETSPFAFAYHLAETARSWRGGFAFPVAYAVVWPACALSALATCADALRGEGTAEREARTESKKSR